MKRELVQRVALGFGLLAMMFAHAPGRAADRLSAEEAQKIGVEAVVYGLPLVVMDVTKRITTKLGRCLQGSRVGLPMFQFGPSSPRTHLRAGAAASTRARSSWYTGLTR